MKIAFFTQMQY